MKKRILSLLLTLVMILGMIPAMAPAASAAGNYIRFGIVKVPAGSYLEQGKSTATTTKPADNYAYYDGTTLELHNYIDTWSVFTDGFDLLIRLYGYNYVHAVVCNDLTTDMASLCIEGNGTLSIGGCIEAKDLSVNSGNLELTTSSGDVFVDTEEVTYPKNSIALCSKNVAEAWEPFDLDKVKDKDYKRVMIISGVFFGSQSPAMPEGKTAHDLGKVSASEYVMTFASQDMPSSLGASGYKVVEKLVVYDRDNNGEIVDTVTNNPQLSGTGISYSLKNLPSGNYRIRESIILYDKDGKALFGTNNDFILEVERTVNNINVSATFSGTPAKATTSTKGATVTATKWYKKNGSSWTQLGASDTIKEGGSYRCEVTVASTNGYTLADGYTVKINGTAATKKSGNTWYRDVTITGYITYVDVYDISLPEAYTNPDFTYNDEGGAAYHWDVVQVEWFECDKDGRILSGALTKNDVFQKDTYYRVEVTVVPETNWKFHDTDLSFYINDDAAMPLYGYNKAYPNSVTGYVVYNTADIEGDYELFVYDDSLSGSAKNIYIKDGQYLGSNATGATAKKPASGGYAYYKDGVLTLNGYKNEKAHFIFEELALELYLVGDNTIGAIYDNEFGMAGGNLETRQGNLVIDAADGGKLTIASNPLDAYANIQAKDLYFNGGELTSCLANDTYGAAVQLNGGNLYLENGYVAYVSDTNDFASATKWDGKTDISTYDCVWIVPEKVSGSGVTVNCIGDIDYTVSGNVVIVTHDKPCKLGYANADGKYVTLTAIKNSDGSYAFTVPTDVTEVILAVKGDISGDGRINVGDVSKLYAHVKQTNPLSGDTLFIADISGDNRINVGDVSKLYASVKQTAPLTWDT